MQGAGKMDPALAFRAGPDSGDDQFRLACRATPGSPPPQIGFGTELVEAAPTTTQARAYTSPIWYGGLQH